MTEPQPAHCNHLSDDAGKDPARQGKHEPHVWHDYAINQNNDYWCDGSDLLRADPTIEALEDARRWIGILHRRSIADLDRQNLLAERIRYLERPWWKRLRKQR